MQAPKIRPKFKISAKISALILALMMPLVISAESSALAQVNETMIEPAVQDSLLQNSEMPPWEMNGGNDYAETGTELSADLYALYRIADRITRANGLEVPYWDVVWNSSLEDLGNASAPYVIGFNTNLLDLMAGDVSAVAFIVAHEMFHHASGHVADLAALQREFFQDIVAEADSFNPFEMMFDLEFQRRIEAYMKPRQLEADRGATLYIAQAGFDPEGALHAFDVLIDLYGLDESMAERLEALRTFIAEHSLEESVDLGQIRLNQTSPFVYEQSPSGAALRMKPQDIDYGTLIDDMFGQ